MCNSFVLRGELEILYFSLKPGKISFYNKHKHIAKNQEKNSSTDHLVMLILSSTNLSLFYLFFLTITMQQYNGKSYKNLF